MPAYSRNSFGASGIPSSTTNSPAEGLWRRQRLGTLHRGPGMPGMGRTKCGDVFVYDDKLLELRSWPRRPHVWCKVCFPIEK